MRFTHLVLLFGLSAAALAARAQPAAPPEEASDVEGLTVTARRQVPTVAKPGAADPDPFAFFQDYCFDPMRLSRRSARPVGDPAWRRLGGEARAQLGIADSSTVAYARVDTARGLTLVLRIEQGPMVSEVRNDLVQHRCSLTVKGPADAREFKKRMSALFNGAPTDRHLGAPSASGHERTPGWEQWLWSAIPMRGSNQWEVFRSGSFIVVNAPRFYNRCTYVAGELRHTKDHAAPISVLLLTHTFTRAAAADQVNSKSPCR
jgi:hypothetical protein